MLSVCKPDLLLRSSSRSPSLRHGGTVRGVISVLLLYLILITAFIAVLVCVSQSVSQREEELDKDRRLPRRQHPPRSSVSNGVCVLLPPSLFWLPFLAQNSLQPPLQRGSCERDKCESLGAT